MAPGRVAECRDPLNSSPHRKRKPDPGNGKACPAGQGGCLGARWRTPTDSAGRNHSRRDHG